jgi:hypothetical protein
MFRQRGSLPRVASILAKRSSIPGGRLCTSTIDVGENIAIKTTELGPVSSPFYPGAFGFRTISELTFQSPFRRLGEIPQFARTRTKGRKDGTNDDQR